MRRLARVRFVDEERDLIERLDRIDVALGGLRYAATSAPTAMAMAAGLRPIYDQRATARTRAGGTAPGGSVVASP